MPFLPGCSPEAELPQYFWLPTEECPHITEQHTYWSFREGCPYPGPIRQRDHPIFNFNRCTLVALHFQIWLPIFLWQRGPNPAYRMPYPISTPPVLIRGRSDKVFCLPLMISRSDCHAPLFPKFQVTSFTPRMLTPKGNAYISSPRERRVKQMVPPNSPCVRASFSHRDS